ncbi:hypothetical protein [Arcobacter sp.]|uniref:hypothetical protein n=1 Tax=Arcobacter sp. TaxID=1872629 RepID=UPI003D0F2B81
MGQDTQKVEHIKRHERVELVFKIFPEINEVYKLVVDIIDEAKELDEKNVIIQTNQSLLEAFLELMNFDYLDEKKQAIDIEKYNTENKPKIISLFYKAGCDAYTIMAYYYYQEKTKILDKYYVANIETIIADFYNLYESSYFQNEDIDNSDCTKEQMEQQGKLLEKVKEEYHNVLTKKNVFKKASKDIKKKNEENIVKVKRDWLLTVKKYRLEILNISILGLTLLVVFYGTVLKNNDKVEVKTPEPKIETPEPKIEAISYFLRYAIDIKPFSESRIESLKKTDFFKFLKNNFGITKLETIESTNSAGKKIYCIGCYFADQKIKEKAKEDLDRLLGKKYSNGCN